MNPTAEDYEFIWDSVILDTSKAEVVQCSSKRGIIKSNKKTQMTFQLNPEDCDLHESFFNFHIPKHNIAYPFLIVGCVVESEVGFDKLFVNFGPLIVGRSSINGVNIENHTDSPFAWSMDKSAQQILENTLEVTPMTGVVQAHSKMPIKLVFKPQVEKLYSLTLPFTVQHKPTKLFLNVKGEGYNVSVALTIGSSQEPIIPVRSSTVDITTDFGQVQVNDQCIITAAMRNPSKFPVGFKWELQLP